MNFEESQQYLLSLGHETLAIKLGLRNTELLLGRLDHPPRAYRSVQIAGTNGKGSTAVMLDAICRAAKLHTGLFTSPHLVSITERIVIDGKKISEKDFARHATTVRRAAEQLKAERKLQALPTFFEHVTAIALLAFREAKIELAILETGLGGRLDATTTAGANIVGITPVALDHQEYLGETIEEIASEKAAIIHHGATAVIAPQAARADAVILDRCKEMNVTPVRLNEMNITVREATSDGRYSATFQTGHEQYQAVLGLRGRHQLTNAFVAIALAEALRESGYDIPRTAIIDGIENAKHPGRLETHEPAVLLDGAHNPSGALALRAYLEEFVRSELTLVFGAMNDKRLEEIAAILFPVAKHLILTRPDNPRAATQEDLRQLALKFLDDEQIFIENSARDALAKAKQLAARGGVICVTGSLYLLGEVKAIGDESILTQSTSAPLS